MKANVGSIDRMLRIVVGVALLSMLAFVQGNAKFYGLIGLVPLLTGLFRFCPLYTIFGIRTCPSPDR